MHKHTNRYITSNASTQIATPKHIHTGFFSHHCSPPENKKKGPQHGFFFPTVRIVPLKKFVWGNSVQRRGPVCVCMCVCVCV